MFEILMYLFENYMDGSVSLNADPGRYLRAGERFGAAYALPPSGSRRGLSDYRNDASWTASNPKGDCL